MVDPVLLGIFRSAALPQKTVMLLLLGAIPFILLAAVYAALSQRRTFSMRVISHAGMAGLAMGLLTAGLNTFHMAQTILRLPFDPTLKQVAPGIYEISTLVSLGAAVAFTALLAYVTLNFLPGSRAHP